MGDCAITEDSENANTYINNPFIPGTLTYFKAGESQGTFDKDIYYNSGTTYYLQEKYCENGYAKTRTYKCSKGVFSITNQDITSSGCYCMFNSQCGDGKTCVFISTKNFGKCT